MRKSVQYVHVEVVEGSSPILNHQVIQELGRIRENGNYINAVSPPHTSSFCNIYTHKDHVIRAGNKARGHLRLVFDWIKFLVSAPDPNQPQRRLLL